MSKSKIIYNKLGERKMITCVSLKIDYKELLRLKNMNNLYASFLGYSSSEFSIDLDKNIKKDMCKYLSQKTIMN